jgi:hypothetical protein
MSREQLFAITFFGNVCGQPHLLRRLIACISKSDRKMSTARHFALNGNPPLGACIRRRAYIRNDQSISEWWAYTRGGGLYIFGGLWYIISILVYNFATAKASQIFGLFKKRHRYFKTSSTKGPFRTLNVALLP